MKQTKLDKNLGKRTNEQRLQHLENDFPVLNDKLDDVQKSNDVQEQHIQEPA